MCIIYISLSLSLSISSLSLLFFPIQKFFLHFHSLSLSLLIKFFTLLSHYAILSLFHSLSLSLSLSLFLFDYSSNFLITSHLNLHLKGQSQTVNIERIPRASSTETNCLYPAQFARLGMLLRRQHTHDKVKVFYK